MSYSVENLKKEALELQDDATKENEINSIHFNFSTIEESTLLTKIIAGKKDSIVAELIEHLQNSTWVEEGLNYIHVEDESVQCPFCQQRTITKELYKQICDFFDETYKNDKNSLEGLLSQYKDEIQRVNLEIDLLKKNRFIEPLIPEMNLCIGEFTVAASENVNTLEKKIKNTSITVALKSMQKFEERINEIILKANVKIKEFNDKIEHSQDALKSIKERFWSLMRKEYDSVISLYLVADKRHNADNLEHAGKLNEITIEENKQKNVIVENQKKTVNIDEAVENINQGLIDIGITDFSIEKYSEDEALYHLKREHSMANVFKTLSEGEKMVISFLYFVEMCKGETVEETTATNKIVVIDDPISSLSHIYVFNIGRIIHNEFLRTEKYEQVFVLTHSLYFFYELTNINHEEREKTQKLFRIVKNDNGSSIISMKYEEIQNDYQSYWYIIKDENQPPALIANCMRNIMEYFFNFVEKQDFNNVFAKPELKENRFLAFNRYMNRESHSKGQNIFDIKEFDYDSFKSAFKLVFELTGYEKHYKKMMK
ncbi:MAG: AAA family ATPase [Lachnospiraceae bacterium]|nr:AAA family ATPase [Lachnospiraceae bacterium]